MVATKRTDTQRFTTGYNWFKYYEIASSYASISEVVILEFLASTGAMVVGEKQQKS